MQPVTGYSIYDEHLETRGEGLHHIKLYYADCKKAVADFARRGYAVIQSGRFDEDEHYYLDTEKDFGYIIELGNAGRIRRPSAGFPRRDRLGESDGLRPNSLEPLALVGEADRFFELRHLSQLRRACHRPEILESATQPEGDAYAGVSSTMKPSLQPYLASKSAFTMAAS